MLNMLSNCFLEKLHSPVYIARTNNMEKRSEVFFFILKNYLTITFACNFNYQRDQILSLLIYFLKLFYYFICCLFFIFLFSVIVSYSYWYFFLWTVKSYPSLILLLR